MPVYEFDNFFTIWEPNSFDTEEAAELDFRQEQLAEGKKAFIKRIRLFYRDIGSFTVTATVTVLNNDNTFSSVFKQLVVTGLNDNKLKRKFFDLRITGMNPQLVLTRNANSGPFSIVSITLLGELIQADDV